MIGSYVLPSYLTLNNGGGGTGSGNNDIRAKVLDYDAGDYGYDDVGDDVGDDDDDDDGGG